MCECKAGSRNDLPGEGWSEEEGEALTNFKLLKLQLMTRFVGSAHHRMKKDGINKSSIRRLVNGEERANYFWAAMATTRIFCTT